MVSSPTLFPSQAEAAENSLNFFTYWRKKDGWIVAGPAWPQEYAKNLRRGWTPLNQYGTFTPGHRSQDIRGVAFSAAREGWRVGFQTDAVAFAREFLPEQIIAYGWHITPPYREVTFPQLEGIDIPVYDCPECTRLPFYRAIDLSTHLRISHDYSRVDIKAYGDEIGIDFTHKAAREQAEELAKASVVKLEESGYQVDKSNQCMIPGCGWAPGAHVKDHERALRTHVRMAHERTRVPEEEPAQERSESDGTPILQPAN